MKKPFLVWVIVVTTVWGSVSIARFYLGLSPAPRGLTPEMIRALHQTTLFEDIIKIAHGTLSLSAAVALFRLRPVALPLFVATFLVSVFQAVAGPFFSAALRQLATYGVWILSAGPVLEGLILWYVWHLNQTGRLHAQQALPADASASRPRG